MTERQNIEWKSSWRDEYLKWVCGFANAQGGTIIVGKDDDGKVVGVDDARKLLEDIPGKARQLLGLTLDVNLHEQDGKQYVEVVVEPQRVAVSLRGRYYYRSGSTKHELTGVSLNEFLLKKSGTTWDRMPEPGASMDDIDEESVKRFLKDAAQSGRLPEPGAITTEELFEKLRLIKDGKLTRAALILFGKDPGAYFHSLSVKLGRFATDIDIRFQEVIEANLIKGLPEVLEQLDHKFFVKTITFEGIQRIETPPYPKAALREVFLNAMVHRLYNSSTVQARIYDDHMTIWNEGPLPHSIPAEALTGPHASVPRNPLIADICFKAGYIDSWGRGIQKITDACTDAHLPNPKFEEAFGGVLVTLTPEVTPEVTGQVPPEVAGEVTGEVAGEVIRLLQAMRGEMKRQAVQDALGLKHEDHFREAYLVPALELGLITMTILDKPTSRLQKYRLTDKGRAMLKAPVTTPVTPEVTGEVAGVVTGEVTGEVRQLLAAMRGEMKRQAVQDALNLRHEDHFREAYLVPALEAGLVEMTIPDKPRSSKQKYRLTDKGRTMLQQQRGGGARD